MWKVQDWEISCVHTGWRVVRSGVRGHKEIDSGYAYDRYEQGDYAAKKAAAEARCAELNRAYAAQNVIPLHA